jgi:beta-lactamase class A
MISRRKMLFSSAGVLLAWTGIARAQEDLRTLESRRGGRLGFFAVDTKSGRTLGYRADERFLMCSTFKGLLAAQVLARIDAGLERPDRELTYAEKDLIFTSPVTKESLSRGSLPIMTLCKAIVEVSDNTAAILLMRNSGGPEGLTKFIRSLGDDITRSDRYEPESNNYAGELDTTSPRAIAGSARAILLGKVLSSRSRDLMLEWMKATPAGSARLKAAMPADWTVAHKTGTSAARQTNDYALINPPGRAPFVVSAYYDAPHLSLEDREAVLREAGEAFVRWATRRI